jgi:hypothetical protein
MNRMKNSGTNAPGLTFSGSSCEFREKRVLDHQITHLREPTPVLQMSGGDEVSEIHGNCEGKRFKLGRHGIYGKMPSHYISINVLSHEVIRVKVLAVECANNRRNVRADF